MTTPTPNVDTRYSAGRSSGRRGAVDGNVAIVIVGAVLLAAVGIFVFREIRAEAELAEPSKRAAPDVSPEPSTGPSVVSVRDGWIEVQGQATGHLLPRSPKDELPALVGKLRGTADSRVTSVVVELPPDTEVAAAIAVLHAVERSGIADVMLRSPGTEVNLTLGFGEREVRRALGLSLAKEGHYFLTEQAHATELANYYSIELEPGAQKLPERAETLLSLWSRKADPYLGAEWWLCPCSHLILFPGGHVGELVQHLQGLSGVAGDRLRVRLSDEGPPLPAPTLVQFGMIGILGCFGEPVPATPRASSLRHGGPERAELVELQETCRKQIYGDGTNPFAQFTLIATTDDQGRVTKVDAPTGHEAPELVKCTVEGLRRRTWPKAGSNTFTVDFIVKPPPPQTCKKWLEKTVAVGCRGGGAWGTRVDAKLANPDESENCRDPNTFFLCSMSDLPITVSSVAGGFHGKVVAPRDEWNTRLAAKNPAASDSAPKVDLRVKYCDD